MTSVPRTQAARIGLAFPAAGGYGSRSKEARMPDVTIVYWRDIPAQVLVGRGRGGAKRPLPERFEQAIDRAAMKAGLSGTDAYLGEWRKEARPGPDTTPAEAAAQVADDLDAAFSQERLRALIDNGGHAPAG
jgi:hypothetical protein